MSFTEAVKEEIVAGLSKKACCRRAFLFGILYMRAELSGDTVCVALHDELQFETVEKLVFEQFSRESKRIKRPGAVAGDVLCFSSGAALKFLSDLEAEAQEIPFAEKCGNCRKAFLSGTFFAAGRVKAPDTGYRLEFSCGRRRDGFAALLETFDLAPKHADRRNEKLLYFRDSTSIEDLFAHIGATQATFTVMDQKIERAMRNDANRLANCDANNIDKAIASAMRQIELIERLIAENKLSFLSPELEKTARLRLQYPDLSLLQLAAAADPPMTKSGLNHRLKKIVEIAEELLNKKKGDL